MKLQTIFDQLKTGELSQLAIGSGPDGALAEADFPKLLNHINLGLTELFTRFSLKIGTLNLMLVPNQTVYSLTADFAVTNTRSKQAVKYLLDGPSDPFRDDLLKVEEVFTDTGVELFLNQPAQRYAVHTPSFNRVQVPREFVTEGLFLPDELKTVQLQLKYRARHPQIMVPVGYFDPGRVEVALPDAFLNALLLFVASRVHNPVGMSAEFHSGNNYAAKFEQACQLLEINSLDIDTGAQYNRARSNGWA